MSLTTVNFVEDFCQVLDDGGDMFFGMDGGDQDAEMIIATIKRQGYWAGVSLRYFFDMELLEKRIIKLLSTQERSFGS